MTPTKKTPTKKTDTWEQALLDETEGGVAWGVSAHTDRRGRPYSVTVHWAADDRLRPVSITVQAPEGVDTALWREVALGAVTDQLRAAAVSLWESHETRTDLPSADRRRVLDVLAAARPLSQDPAVIDLVAETYLKAEASGDRPTRAVHEALIGTGRDVSRQTAGKLVMRCRRLGLIPPAGGAR